MAEGADFSKHMEHVARAMLQGTHGEPNRALSTKTELRFGKKGSLSVDLQKGTWHDHSADEGGGALDMLRLYGDMEKNEAIEWMVAQGLIPPTEKRGSSGSSKDKFLGFMDHHPIARFRYLDEKGALAYEVWKFPKDAPRRYMQARPAPGGKADTWIIGLQADDYGKTRGGNWFKAKDDKKYDEVRHFEAATRYLYHRDEVLKAIKAGKPIVLVEGEKDVETIREWGMVATTNSGGAKFWTESMTADLAGADIILCPDNDDAGRTRTILRGGELRAVAKRVRILDLAKHWPQIEEKDDVSDWRDRGSGTGEQFAKLLEKAPNWKPEAIPSKYGAISWSDMDATAPDFAYLVDGWVPLDGRSVVGGPSQSGKSFFVLDLALSVARGVLFLGQHVEQGGVIYQAGEGGSGAKKRVKAYREHHGLTGKEDLPFIFIPSKIDLFAKDGDTQGFIDEVNAQKLLLSSPLRLIVIDTLATATAGADENSGKDMGVVLANIAKIEKACGAHVMLVHHMNAAGAKLRGHTSVFADVDAVITIVNDDETKVRTATLSKQKDDETGITLRFELMSVKVGHNAKLDRPITSCVVLPVGEKKMLQAEQQKAGWKLRLNEEKVMTIFFEAERRYGKFVTDENDGPMAAIGHSIVHWNEYREVALSRELDLGDSEEDRARASDRIKKQFERVKDGLEKYGVIGFDRPFMWWKRKPLKGFPQTFPRKSEAAELWSRAVEEQYRSPGLDEVMERDEPVIPF